MTVKHLLCAMLTLIMFSANVGAQQYFRIGTGGTAGTYYPIGVLIAAAVSQPGQIIATAQPSNGSLGNVIGVAGGSLESGFSQADIATWAQTGSGIFDGKPALAHLRLIANLYRESIHVVVRNDSTIRSVADLRGKRVALDEAGSGTLISARQVLSAYGLKETDLKPHYLKPNQAGDRLVAGTLDAFFFTGGVPSAGITELARNAPGIRLLPIDGEAARVLHAGSPYLVDDMIAANAYPGVPATPTLAVGAQWITSDKADADLIYRITRALYSEAGQKALASGHPKAAAITLTNAVSGAGIPLHAGALRFYKEAGVLK